MQRCKSVGEAQMTDNPKGEPQYRSAMQFIRQRGIERLGIVTAYNWYADPKRLTFTFARYKFVAKMLEGRENVLECGCGDGFATRIVAQSVKKTTGIDFDPEFIADARERAIVDWPITFAEHDLLDSPYQGSYDGVYALDVLEHIAPEHEDCFIGNMLASLTPQGVVIIGMPSLPSQEYASPLSKEGHQNCKTGPGLRETMERHFHNVFIFSMNDEVVHTGYHMMAHYLFALCCGKKS